MKNFIKSTLIAIATVGTYTGPMVFTAYAGPVAVEQAQSKVGTFTKKKYRITGSWSVETRDSQTFIRLSEDFRTKNGPDLKIFLSPQSVNDVNGKTAVNGAINLGALQSNKGGSEYLVPAGVNLADFNSLLVHCEAYSVLWGAGDLT